MEASVAQCAWTTLVIAETITPWIIREAMEILMQTDLSIKEETHNTTPRTHLVAGTTGLSRWT